MTEHNIDTTKTPAAGQRPADSQPERPESGKELGDDALQEVSGGLNPQPLPPGRVMPTT